MKRFNKRDIPRIMNIKIKKNSKNFVLCVFILLLALSGCSDSSSSHAQNDTSGTLTVSAAASLQQVLEEVGKAYNLEKPEVKITFNFASSGTLQRQIEQGAPVDIFISAAQAQMDVLSEKDLLDKDTRINLLRNEIVLIGGKDYKDVQTIQDLTSAKVNKIGIGTPETVPAGKYAKEVLVNLNLWETLQAKYVLAKDVKQVLTYVETGNVEVGFVYLSDAVGSDKVKIIKDIPDELHSPIIYLAAIIKGSTNKASAQDFLNFIQSDQAHQIFEKYGLRVQQ